ncbi:hypothetical protein D3C71_1203620 [compost metagenome]
MDGLEHAGVAALGVDVAGGRNAQAARQCGGQVAEDVGMQVGGDDGVERGGAVDHAGRGGVHQLLVPFHIGELGRHLRGNLVPHHHRVALRVALGDDGELLAGARLRQAEGKAQDALHAHAGHDGDIGGRLDGVALVHAAAHARVFAFGVFAHDDPVQVLGRAALERRVDARQDARGPHVGVLIEPLTDLEAQAPERDVVGDVRVTRRAKQDGVLAAQGIQPVGRHHHAVRAVPVAAPVEVFKLELQAGVAGGQGFEHALARGNHFLADAVSGDGGDLIGCHAEAWVKNVWKCPCSKAQA